jgi:hypothetical protein
MCWPVEFLPNKLIYSKETTLILKIIVDFACRKDFRIMDLLLLVEEGRIFY